MTDLASRLLRRSQPQPLPHVELSPRATEGGAPSLAFLDEPADDCISLDAPPTATGFEQSPVHTITHHETFVERHLRAEPSTHAPIGPSAPGPLVSPQWPTGPVPTIAPVTITRVIASAPSPPTMPTSVVPASHNAGPGPRDDPPGTTTAGHPRPTASPQPAASLEREPSRLLPAISPAPATPPRSDPTRFSTVTSPVTTPPRQDDATGRLLTPSPTSPPPGPVPPVAPPHRAAPHRLDPPLPGPLPPPSPEPPPPRVVIDSLHIELVREAPRPGTPPPSRRRAPTREGAPRNTATRVRPRLAFGMRQL